MKTVLIVACTLLVTAALAQHNPSLPSKDSGWYESTLLSAGHDTAAGWSSQMDSSVGYSFNRIFAAELGAPFYLANPSQTTSTTGTTSTTSHSAALGDVFLRLKANKEADALSYSTGLTLAAPTGDTSAGVSSGRGTIAWDNRLEHNFDRASLFGEGSLGNSLRSTRRYVRDYTTLGAVSEFRGGLGFDLLKNLSLEGSGFADVGYGNQKIFSRTVGKGRLGAPGAVKHNRVFQSAYLTSGSASLADDNGLTADLNWHPAPRVYMEMAYNHSFHFAADSVAMTIGFHLGHMANSTK